MTKKKQGNSSHFCLKLKLKVEPWQADIIDKRMEAGRQVYNALVAVSLKRWNELKKTKRYRALIASLNHDKKHPEHDAPIWKEINAMREAAGLTKYGLIKMVTQIRQHFKEHVGAHVAQKLAKNLWDAYENLFYGNGKKIRFRKYGQRNSLEGQDNRTSIRYIKETNTCLWSKLSMPLITDPDNEFEAECLAYPIAYCRILREYIRGKRRYFIQIVFKGIKPEKRKKDGSFKHPLGKGDVGIDIGTSTVACASATEVYIDELAKGIQTADRNKYLLQRKLDRSRRATNPKNFNKDGTIKKGRKKWARSKEYMRTLGQLKEANRKVRVLIKQSHEMLANHIIELGDKFYVEDMNFKALQKRAELSGEEEKDKNGRFKRKKRYGKSLLNHSPAMFLQILKNKLRWLGSDLVEIDTWNARASQFNHLEQQYVKKKLSQRWNHVKGYDIQRDLYSAFLIMNINPDLKTFNQKKCDDRFPGFMKLHDAEVERLKGNKNLSCIAI